MLRLDTDQKRRFLLQEKRIALRSLERKRLLHVMDAMLEAVCEDVPDEVIEEEFEEIHSGFLDEFNAAVYDHDATPGPE